MLLYYITDRSQFPGDEINRRSALLTKMAEAARAGVDYIQLREKDLVTRDLETLALSALTEIRPINATKTVGGIQKTCLLINSRLDVALAVGADGMHLPADEISVVDVRQICRLTSFKPDPFLIARSCHTKGDVAEAARTGADFAVFAPVFEKKVERTIPPAGLKNLEQACLADIPVLALGGVTTENANACVDAGAAGVAGIRLFQDHDVFEVVRRLRR